MLRVSATPRPARTLAGLGLLTAVLTVSGCGTPPGTATSSQPPATTASPGVTVAAGTVGPGGVPVPGVPGPTGVAGPAGTGPVGARKAVACAGHPDAAQIITLLRRSAGMVPPDIRATVTTGPLCAEDWQFSVVQVRGRDPLQVVTQGPATALTLVTAGTDVCIIPVRAGAPAPIRALACDGGDSLTTPG